MWFGPYSCADLSETLKQSVRFSDDKYPPLSNYGFYMFLDQSLSPKYIGQAFDNTSHPAKE